MKRIKILKILNPIIAILILNQAITGIFHKSIFYKTYEWLHGGGGIITLLAIILHVILNWNWVRANFLKK
jgi:hypothetical protein